MALAMNWGQILCSLLFFFMSKWYFQFCGTGNPMVFDRKWKDPVADSFRSQVCRFPTDGQQPQGGDFSSRTVV
jgi:hypothetical protein